MRWCRLRLSWHDELIWASGLFEGEGCITQRKNNRCLKANSPSLSLGMTDEDSVRRFHAAVGVGSVGGPYGPYGGRVNEKPHWQWVCGGFHQTQAVLAMLWSGLGTRRKERAKEVLRGVV